MKKSLLLYLILSANISFSQITIDSFAVYNSGTILDSFYLKTTSQGQLFFGIALPAGADFCSTILGYAYFKGCETGITTTFDTMYVYGYPSYKMNLDIYWDTSFSCSQPSAITFMDNASWNICNSLEIKNNLLNFKLTIFPNPTKDVLYLENLNQIYVDKISLYNQYGSKIKDFSKHEEVFDLSHLPEGIFFLRIDTEKGVLVKKVIHQSE